MASYKLRRSSKDKILFGVCGGIAEYFNIDSLFVRIAFIITAFFNGFGIILYIALALIMPKEEAEIGDISQVIRENIQSIKEDAIKAGQSIKESFTSAEDQEKIVTEAPMAGNDHRRNTFAFVLIIIGIIFLLANFGIFWWFEWDKLWPAILILLGIIIILKRRR